MRFFAWMSTTLLAAAAPAQLAAVNALLEEHCFSCHGEDKVSGDLDLTAPAADHVTSLWRWSRIRERVRSFEMPPAHVSEVSPAEREAVVGFVDALLADEVPRLAPDGGEVTVRRLSRYQWRNTVLDQLGVEVDVADFPADDLGYGFDTIGDALTFSTLHLEKYLQAAEAVAADVFHGEDPARPERRVFAGGGMQLVGGRGATMGAAAHMDTRSTIEQAVTLPRDGSYRVRIAAKAQQAGDEPARMSLQLDGGRLELLDVPNRRLREFVIERPLKGGAHVLGISFVNDFYDPKNPDRRRRDRNLDVESVIVEGPIDVRETPAAARWLSDLRSDASDAERLRAQVDAMLPRLWRRVVTPAERQRLFAAGSQRLVAGGALVDAQRFVLTAALASPHFLFRAERGGRGDAELATRLAYFLWASAPDDDLRARGRDGLLGDEAALAAQVERMLRDPRADRLAGDFAAQWLELRGLARTHPDPDRFPLDDDLRVSFRRETELLFLAVLREGRDVRQLVDCDFTHVDARLANYYGLSHEGPPGEFVRADLVGAARLRGGILGHASVLAVTSNPTRTSPVKRGKWILDNLLGQPPPPPPPGNDSFEDEAAIDDAATLRDQMAQHRERSKCAVCHLRMDALGLSLERFDAIGRFRVSDGAGVIDASATLPDGTGLDGLADLKRAVAADPAFVRTVAHKLFVYAVGRELRPIDRLRIDEAVAGLLSAGEVTLRDLIMLVVVDPAFSGERV